MTQDNLTISFHDYWSNRGHWFGECMSGPDLNWMYVKIPKNASIWAREILLSNNLEFYHYHKLNFYHKHALVILRDPIDRWVSGIAEYFARYHMTMDIRDINKTFIDLLVDIVTVDDHTEKQIYFIEGLNVNNCTFLLCDQTLRDNFANWMKNIQRIENQYQNKAYQNVGNRSVVRAKFQTFFKGFLDDPKYVEKIKQHYKQDYELLNSVKYYGPR